MPESYLIALVAAFGYAVIFVAFRHSCRIGWFVLEVVLGASVCLIGMAMGSYLAPFFNVWYFVSLYSACWLCFFFVSGIFYVSVSVEIIRFLGSRPARSATTEEIYEHCIKAPFAERANFLVDVGQATCGTDGFAISPSGLRTADRIRSVQRIFRFGGSGYYSIGRKENDPG